MSDDVDRVQRELDASRAREAALLRRLATAAEVLEAAERQSAGLGEVELERDAARAKGLELARRVEVLEADLQTRDELLERSRRVHAEMQSSLSWRVTAPLRAVRRS